MALTITSVNPTSGLTAGREFVLITGTGFNIAVDAQGASRMEVKFGASVARRVRVRSTTVLDCLNPINDEGTYVVTLKNLDTAEVATLPGAFTYRRPALTGSPVNSGLWCVQDALIRELRRQIIDEVVLTTQTDFDEQVGDELNIVKIAKLPSIVLIGPDVSGSGGPHARTEEPLEEAGGGTWKQRRPLDVVTLRYMLHGVDDHQVRLTNLLQVVIGFFRRNPVLRVLSNPADPNSEVFEIDMRPPNPQEWRSNNTPSIHNLRHFSGPFSLVGVPIGRDDFVLETKGGSEGGGVDLDFVLEPTDTL